MHEPPGAITYTVLSMSEACNLACKKIDDARLLKLKRPVRKSGAKLLRVLVA